MSYPSAENSAYLKRRYDAQRQFFISLLGGKCQRCKATTQLEVDHIDPAAKTVEIGRLFTKNTIVAAVAELVGKCQLLCARCHRKKTATEFSLKPKTFQHATLYGWMKAKCQCPLCQKAKWCWHDARNTKRRKRDRPNLTARGGTADAQV